MADLIERKAAIDALDKLDYTPGEWAIKGLTMCKDAIKAVPSVQPERKTGKWVHGREIAREMVGDAITAIFYEGWQCSECKCIVEEEREPLWKFCPNCGAKMEEKDDR